jgi:YD repeat-containing protein
LYPTTVTNALGQATQYTYDYSLGKPTVVIDPNGSRNETAYDGLDRTVSVRQSDPNNPGQTMLVKQINYTDNTNPRSVRELTYLDSDTNAVEKITYHPSPNPNAVITLQLGE